MTRRLLLIAGIIAVVLVLTQLIIPPVVSQFIARGMAEYTGSDSVTVKAEKNPAIMMLGGGFDSIAFTAANVKTDKLIFSKFTANMSAVELDMNSLIGSRKVAFESLGKVDATAEITQEELSRIISQAVKGVKNASVTIVPDKIEVKGSFVVGGLASVAVAFDGKITADSEKIKFVTDKFKLNNSFAGNLGGAILAEIPLAEQKKLPFGVKVTQAQLTNGKVIIYANNYQTSS